MRTVPSCPNSDLDTKLQSGTGVPPVDCHPVQAGRLCHFGGSNFMPLASFAVPNQAPQVFALQSKSNQIKPSRTAPHDRTRLAYSINHQPQPSTSPPPDLHTKTAILIFLSFTGVQASTPAPLSFHEKNRLYHRRLRHPGGPALVSSRRERSMRSPPAISPRRTR